MKIIKKMVNRIINIMFDCIINNYLVYYWLKIRIQYITPRINKLIGRIVSNRIKNKGTDLRIHGNIEITGIEKLKIGNYVRIGKGAYFSCEGGLTIGDNVQISRNVLIYTNSHNINSMSVPYDNTYTYKPVIIGNSAWIGMNVNIAPGSIIGEGAVIGMGCTVSGEIPKGAIVVSQKQRIINYRDIEDFDQKEFSKNYFGKLFPDN